MKFTSRLILFIVLVIALAIRVNLAAAQPAAGDFSKVDAYIAETMRRLPIKGLALAIVQGDQVVYMKGYGTANIQGDPATAQTPFMIGSITKTFTALAVQQLIHNNKVDEYSPVQKYVPEFHLAKDTGELRVTVRHLLDHTSGISKEEGEAPYFCDPKATFPQALAQLARYKPEYEPGEHYEYSNWNYALLREVIANASGQSYTRYVQQHILDPLDMPRASFADFRTLPHGATYDLNVFGFPVPYDELYSPMLVGSGNMSASAEEMAHYMIAFLNQGQYSGQAVLRASSSGWYDAYWNNSMHGSTIQFSGGHNSTSANLQLFPPNRLGVVVLMNTRLDEVIPTAPNANDIGANIANIVRGQPYSLPNFNGFYLGVAVMDGLLLLFIAGSAWQALRIKTWRKHYQAARFVGRMGAWMGILLDLAICIGLAVVPSLFDATWSTILFLRPDFGVPVLAVGICLGALGLIKIGITLRMPAIT